MTADNHYSKLNLMDNHKQSFLKIIALFELIFILGLSYSLYFFNQQLKITNEQFSNLQGRLASLQKTPEPKFQQVEINSWLTFSNPDYNFTLNYPKKWHLEKGIISASQDLAYENYVRLSSHPDQCSDCTESEAENYYEFFIRDWGIINDKNKTTDALEYQLRGWLDFVEKEEGPPTIPGFTQKPLNRATLFNNQDVSATAVKPYYPKPNENLIGKEYVLITPNYHKYVINIVAPSESFENGEYLKDNSPLKNIITSLKCK